MGMRIVDRDGMTKMTESFSRFGTAQQDGIRPLGRSQRQLIQGQAFPARAFNSSSGRFGKAQGTHTQLGGTLQHANIVRHLADNDGRLALFFRHVLGQAVQPNGRSIHLAHVQSFQDGRTKFGFRTTGQKLVQFNQQLVVRIGRLDFFHRRRVTHAATARFQINAHGAIAFYYKTKRLSGKRINGVQQTTTTTRTQAKQQKDTHTDKREASDTGNNGSKKSNNPSIASFPTTALARK